MIGIIIALPFLLCAAWNLLDNHNGTR